MAIKGNLLVLIYAFLVVAFFTWLGLKQANYERRMKKLNNRFTLLTLWFVFGALLLFWPLALNAIDRWVSASTWLSWLNGIRFVQSNGIPFFQSSGSFKDLLPVLAVAVLIGAAMSCVWVGWYLAVMLSCNAHNLEAGGAARIEGYNEFIRIKLTNDELTAYVIGFNDAREDGKDLAFRLIDTFTVRPGKPEAVADAGGPSPSG